MPRLADPVSGVVVVVSDETADRLGSEWASADEPKKKAAAKKSASSSKSDK